MNRHRNRPWISLLVLVAVAGALLAWPAPATRAQTTTYPGQNDPLGSRAGGLSQFPDDELVVVSDATNDPAYSIQEFSPNPDYTFPATATDSDPLAQPYAGNLQQQRDGYQHVNVTAKGRVVVPTRDVALTLTKTGYNAASQTTSWALQEMSFSAAGVPKSVPPLTWSAQAVAGVAQAQYTPGALAVDDLDRVLTPDATYGAIYNDEAVVAYEVRDGANSQVRLDVVSYVAAPGTATVAASTTTGSTNTGTFAYPCNISWRSNGNCTQLPGNIEVATGDMDGDGFEDIILFAMMYQASGNLLVQQTYLYSLCPAGLLASDPRVTAVVCTAGAARPTLVLRGMDDVNSTVFGNLDLAMFQQPADLAVGDFDGDGGLELAVLHQTYQFYEVGPGGLDWYGAYVTLSLMQWTFFTPNLKTWVKVWTNEGPTGLPATNSWSNDPDQTTFFDMHLAAGLFKFDPQLGYTTNRRQLAVAYTLPLKSRLTGEATVQLELWDLASPFSPGPNPPKEWTWTRYDTGQQQALCPAINEWASFALEAGSWAGVKANPANPLWGVGLAYQDTGSIDDTPQVSATLYRVDQNVDPKTANGPLSPADTATIPAHGAAIGNYNCGTYANRVELVSLDYDGDTLQLGPPMHTVVQIPHAADWILQEPPQHLDYFPQGGLINVSRTPAFNVGYTDARAKAFAVGGGGSSSWNVGTSVKGNATIGVDGNYLLGDADVSVSVTNQFNYDYQANQSTYVVSSDTYTSTVATQTSGGDSVRFRSSIIDIWRYPVYGAKSATPGQPYSYYELTLPRQTDTPYQDMDDLAAQTYGYQPIHENGNILSYPAVPAGEAFAPPDLGQQLLPALSDQPPEANAVRCEDGIRWCVSSPFSNPGQQFSVGGVQNTQLLEIEETQTNSSSHSWTSKLSDSLDIEASGKFTVFGTKSTGCVNVQVHGGYSWGGASTKTFASDDTQTLSVNIPANNDTSVPYHINPMMYVTGDGTLKVAHGAGTDNAGSFWSTNYYGDDPALNLPRKFNKVGGAASWELNKQWLDAQQMRGFWVRSATPNPVTNTYDVVDGVEVGQHVLLDARVYNYSVGTASGAVPVRFDLEPVDTARNFLATGPRFTAGTVRSAAIPFHGQADSSGKVQPNYTSARLELDTSTLQLPAGQLSQTYRVWVVLDSADPANTANQTHGWRQSNVIVTPKKTLSAGTTVTLALQNAGGTNLGTVSYTSQGTDDNIAVGLMNALNTSPVMAQFGATANVQDTTTSTPSIVVFKRGATPPAGSEYRAGMVAGSDALYFVPQVPGSGVPTLTATNLEYGQNNEGWGLLTVYRGTVPGPMLGGDDPCALSSGYSAERGPDIQLRRASLTPMPTGGVVAGGKTVVQAGERVPIRVSAYAATNWAGFERVTVFQGEPEDGTVAGTALIRGIDAKRGGQGWFTWQAPSTPGTYTLVAQLEESWNDAAAGNNTATVEIVVEPGQKLPYRRYLGAISRGPN